MTHAPSEPEAVADSRCDEWAALYDQYGADVWRYVATLIGSDSHAVGDAVQETFLAAAKAFHQFDPARGTVWAWLTGIAHRQVALHWRRVRRDRIGSAGVPVEDAAAKQTAAEVGGGKEAATTDAAGGGEAVARLIQIETVEVVRRVLAELAPESAAILQGKYCDGCSIAELVEKFGGTTEGVRSRLARARREFKRRHEVASRGAAPQTPLNELSRSRKPAGDGNG